ncbi:major facilitator superfamily domain-containing protein [Nemania serpens]|nr:major facilitator superfamily domain-containing protein [Nemania serpens]
MFFALQVDRGNTGQAVSDNMLQELGMTTNDFNLANTIFTVTFLLAELPSQLVSKKIGPDRWIPTLITLWSVVAIVQATVRNRQGFFAARAVLGLLVGGFVPDIVLWLSYFYTSKELPIRLSIFLTTISVSGIVTTFSGLGILFLRGRGGWSGWRWLFLIQGLLTLVVGVSSFFMMPPSILQTKTWFRPNGWFTEREEAIAVNRILRDDPSKGDMHNRQAITLPRLWGAAKNYDLWPIYALSFLSSIPQSPPSNYLTIILRNLGFSTFVTNLLTVPSSVVHIFTLLAITWLSERFRERTIFAMAQNLWSFPCLIALRVWPGLVKDVWGTYALVTVLLSYPSSQAIMVGWLSKNSNNVGTRSVSVAFSNTKQHLLQQDSPLYHKGNTDLIIINAVCLASFGLTKVFYILRNRHRDRVWASMTLEGN